MGLFSSIAKIIPGPIGSFFSAQDSKKAANKANTATQLGITNATGALNDQFAATSANLTPWITTGQQAEAGRAGLLGLNGADAQATGIAGLQASPLYQSLMRNGQDTLLNNASATGGLRGGNFQTGLANFSADTLTQVIQNQLANLGGISSQGLGAAGQLGSFGAANAGQIAGLNTASGSANANTILGKQAIDNKLFEGIRQQIASAVTAGGGGGAIGAGGAPFNLSAALGSILGGSGGIKSPTAPASSGFAF